MKLSEQIANSCCGVLADNASMVKEAEALEALIAFHESHIKQLKDEMMEIGSE